jgi:putative aldouronate transport system permease protein
MLYKEEGGNMSARIKDSVGDKIFNIFINIFLWASLIVVLYPIIYIVSASFSTPSEVISGKVWLWPVKPTLLGYQAVFKNKQLVTGFENSFFYMIVGTTVNLAMTMLAAFPLSRKEFYGRNVIMTIFLFSIMFSGGLIPTYLVVKNLGLVDSRWALIIPTAMSIWNVIITRTYIKATIPDEMYEAAQIDGCDDIKFLFKIVLPLSGPIIAVMALYYGVANWNSYFNALIYLTNERLFPLQIVLRNILIMNKIDATMMQDFEMIKRRQGMIQVLKYAVIVVASVPVLCIYPFVQKYFIKGVMIGAVKG